MIKPTKYTNLDLSIVSISAEIIKLFKKNKFVKYDDVFSKVLYRKGESSRDVFVYALNFLFLLNLINYHKEEDILEFYETK